MTNNLLILNKLKLIYSNIEHLGNYFYRAGNYIICVCKNAKVHKLKVREKDRIRLRKTYIEVNYPPLNAFGV